MFNVAFGTLTAEEAVIRLVPSMEDTGVYEWLGGGARRRRRGIRG